MDKLNTVSHWIKLADKAADDLTLAYKALKRDRVKRYDKEGS